MDQELRPLSHTGRYLVLGAGFLGWLFAGVQLAISSIVMRDAVKDLLDPAGAARDRASRTYSDDQYVEPIRNRRDNLGPGAMVMSTEAGSVAVLIGAPRIG